MNSVSETLDPDAIEAIAEYEACLAHMRAHPRTPPPEPEQWPEGVVKAPHEIASMDEYLANYGRILGRKAIKALSPLHVPNRDPLPDFDDLLREPFPCQAHVAAAAIKMMDARGSGFIVGEMGCIAGESEIYDPVAGISRRVDQITEPFHVECYDETSGTVAVGDAHVPFIKGRKALYRITLDFGKSFLCTHDHVVLTKRGWLRADQLDVRDDKLRVADPRFFGGVYVTGWEAIRSIHYERTDVYYDFTVDVYHNYLMAGVVHHNTGKTLVSIVAVHKHAQRSKQQGGLNGNYRAIVLCPDHLISKWKREIQKTIAGATVVRFGPQGEEIVTKTKKRVKRSKAEQALLDESNTRKALRDTVALLRTRSAPTRKLACGQEPDGREDYIPVSTGPDTFELVPPTPKPTSGKVEQIRARWAKPEGAEWYVVGRNQAKWLSGWCGIADEQKGFDGNDRAKSLCSKAIIVDRVPKKDENDRPIVDHRGNYVMTNVLAQVHTCPQCGGVIRDKRGTPLAAKDLTSGKKVSQKMCKATYLESVYNPDKPKAGRDTISPCPARHADKAPGTEINHAGRRWKVRQCNTPLFNWNSRLYRWSPARIIQKQMSKMFNYLVADEIHEHKSDTAARSMACSKLIGSVKHVLGLTGTIIGGYANHLYPLMYRITPKTLLAEGFEWGADKGFSEIYGRIDTVITTTEKDDSACVTGRMNSMRKAKSGDRSVTKNVKPGVMPTMFARHMLGTSIFMTLDEMADELPDLFEYVGGPCPEFDAGAALTGEELAHAKSIHERQKDGWVEVACHMEPAQAEEYRRISAIMEFTNKELLKKGSMKFLGSMLWTSLDYPDRPFGWDHDIEVKKAFNRAQTEALVAGDMEAAAKCQLGHVVGYWDKPNNRKIENFIGVVTPKSLPEDVIYPKEQALIDICTKQKADGKQTWVYVEMTGKRNIQPRLKSLLEAQGLRVGILRADTVDPIEREDWIEANGRDYDVMLSHPQLVSTGLDLFSSNQGGHNYSTIVFYETGYNLFTMRQAARRAWRIGQPHDCRIYYLYYLDTMQHKAMGVMSRKMSAAQALEGEFSEEGLAAMAGEDNLQMAMAKSMSEVIDSKDMQRSWSKVKSGPKKRKASSAIDRLSPEAQATIVGSTASEMITETLAEKKPIPIQATLEFPRILQEINRVNAVLDYEEAEETEEELDADFQSYAPAPSLPIWGTAKPEPVQPTSPPEARPESQPEPLAEPAPNPEPIVLRMVSADDDDDYDADYEPDDIPELSEETLALMFANMREHGLI